MEAFGVRSAAMFAKELEVGWLTCTLIRLAMLAAVPSLPAAPQRHKVAHEPRAVRRTPQVYPVLKGDRHAAVLAVVVLGSGIAFAMASNNNGSPTGSAAPRATPTATTNS